MGRFSVGRKHHGYMPEPPFGGITMWIDFGGFLSRVIPIRLNSGAQVLIGMGLEMPGKPSRGCRANGGGKSGSKATRTPNSVAGLFV